MDPNKKFSVNLVMPDGQWIVIYVEQGHPLLECTSWSVHTNKEPVSK